MPAAAAAAAAPAPGLPRYVLTVAVLGVAAACKGEAATEPAAPYPYDIIFERREGTSALPDLYYLDLETGEAARILASTVAGMHPSAAPVGSQVAFVRNDAEFDDEIFIGPWSSTTRQLSGLTNLSNSAAVDEMPALSPNAQRVAFVSDRDGSHADIFVVNTNGTNLRRITPVDPFPAVTNEWWPAWSPNGQQIAYSSTIDGTPDIWTTTVDATSPLRERLTATADQDYHPTWSPDGLRIAFHRIDQNTGDANIVIYNVNARAIELVINMPGQQLWPAWSPDLTNQRIAFSSNHEGADFEIYTMRPDGTDVVRRTDNGVNDLRPTWLIRPVQ